MDVSKLGCHWTTLLRCPWVPLCVNLYLLYWVCGKASSTEETPPRIFQALSGLCCGCDISSGWQCCAVMSGHSLSGTVKWKYIFDSLPLILSCLMCIFLALTGLVFAKCWWWFLQVLDLHELVLIFCFLWLLAYMKQSVQPDYVYIKSETIYSLN